jgi:hypothetical protein
MSEWCYHGLAVCLFVVVQLFVFYRNKKENIIAALR